MQKGIVKVIEHRMKRIKDTWCFTVRAESGGESLKFEMSCPNHQLSQENLDKINESFRNSIRFMKHYAGFPNREVSKEDMDAAMNKLTSTNYGIGIRISEDPLPEYTPFFLR
jgi:hypothetical protein